MPPNGPFQQWSGAAGAKEAGMGIEPRSESKGHGEISAAWAPEGCHLDYPIRGLPVPALPSLCGPPAICREGAQPCVKVPRQCLNRTKG